MSLFERSPFELRVANGTCGLGRYATTWSQLSWFWMTTAGLDLWAERTDDLFKNSTF